MSEISAVNLTVGWCEFASSMNLLISCLLTSPREKISSIYGVQIVGFVTLLLRILVSMTAVKGKLVKVYYDGTEVLQTTEESITFTSIPGEVLSFSS